MCVKCACMLNACEMCKCMRNVCECMCNVCRLSLRIEGYLKVLTYTKVCAACTFYLHLTKQLVLGAHQTVAGHCFSGAPMDTSLGMEMSPTQTTTNICTCG